MAMVPVECQDNQKIQATYQKCQIVFATFEKASGIIL